MAESSSMTAPCGLDCSACEIFKAAQDPIAAEVLAKTWRAAGMEQAKAEWFRCRGCRGDRSVCWTDDCRIYACSVEERGLSSCADCPDFPCKELETWSAWDDSHMRALENLKAIRAVR